MIISSTEIKDVPEWAMVQPYPFWICKVKDGDLIFHGAYLTKNVLMK